MRTRTPWKIRRLNDALAVLRGLQPKEQLSQKAIAIVQDLIVNERIETRKEENRKVKATIRALDKEIQEAQ